MGTDNGPDPSLDLFDVVNASSGVTVDHNEVGMFARGDGSDSRSGAEEFGSVFRGDIDPVGGCEPGLGQQFQFALVAETSRITSASGRVFVLSEVARPSR